MSVRRTKFAIFEKALAKELAYFMSMSDADVESHVVNSRIKERVGKLGAYDIVIHTLDHDPPHFHVKSRDGLNVRFRIDDGSKFPEDGDLRSGVLKRIRLWYNDIKTQELLRDLE